MNGGGHMWCGEKRPEGLITRIADPPAQRLILECGSYFLCNLARRAAEKAILAIDQLRHRQPHVPMRHNGSAKRPCVQIPRMSDVVCAAVIDAEEDWRPCDFVVDLIDEAAQPNLALIEQRPELRVWLAASKQMELEAAF